MSSSLLRRSAGFVVVPALALSGLAGLTAAPAHAADVDPAPLTAGTTWLADQLTAGVVHNDQFDFDDLGLTADIGLALAAIGDTETTELVATALGDRVEEYYSYTIFGTEKVHVSAGSLAKAAVLAGESGNDPTAFGGKNLIDLLSKRVSTDPTSSGRIGDQFYPEEQFEADFANTIGQSFAVAALDEAGSPLTDSATDYLAAQQCEEGYFRLALGATLAEDCDADPTAAASTDVTALAVLNLLSQTDDTDVQTIVGDAVSWLKNTQAADGSWGSDAPTEAANANSTGLAAWALGEVGETAAAEQGAAAVRALQADDLAPCATGLTSETGAIAYDRTAKKTARSGGITAETQDQFRRATAQALPALRWAPVATGATVLPEIPAGAYANGGRTISFPLGGFAPGDTVCALRGNEASVSQAGPDGIATVAVRIPEKTGAFSFSILTDANLGSVTFEALGATKVPFSFKQKVRAGGKQVVKVRGLAPNEKVKVVVRGVAKKGTATKAGRFSATFKVGRKVGRAGVRVVGQFADRKANRAFRVVR